MPETILRYGDDYPTQCPPREAYPPIDMTLYRICKSKSQNSSLTLEDFVPVWEQPHRKFPRSQQECGAKALSFNDSLAELSDLMENFPNIGNRIVRIDLNELCGLIHRTSRNHYNLWDFTRPNIIEAIGNQWEEVV